MQTDREEWRRRIERWRDSGLTAEEFASELGIKAGTLKFWKYKLGKEQRMTRGSARTAEGGRTRASLPLVEVRPSAAMAASGFELELGNGRRLRIPASFEAQALEQLLTVLGRTP